MGMMVQGYITLWGRCGREATWILDLFLNVFNGLGISQPCKARLSGWLPAGLDGFHFWGKCTVCSSNTVLIRAGRRVQFSPKFCDNLFDQEGIL